MQIGHTAETTAPAATFISNTGLSFVYAGTEANDGFTPIAGSVNNLTFGTGAGTTSSFVWDGTSNIVVSDGSAEYQEAFEQYQLELAEYNNIRMAYQSELSQYNAAAIIYNNKIDEYQNKVKSKPMKNIRMEQNTTR